MDERIARRIARLYDLSVGDWPGEIDFYRALAAEAAASGGAVLEVACGTGRVALRLAQDGVRVVGLDASGAMLEVAREKSRGIENVRWAEGDMRAFELGESFALALIPGHSFQFMLTSEDQFASLGAIRRHLAPGGRLVVHLDHQDVAWLGELRSGKGGRFEPEEELTDPETGNRVRVSRAWSYEPSTQTAAATTVWEEIAADGAPVERWERGPVPLHCAFRFEVEHLLARAGFAVEALYGDFFRGELRDDSSEMIWIARSPAANGPSG